jgi:hypothetical protein
MALLAAGQLTLADVAKRLAPDGSVADVAEVLSQSNEVLEDAVFVQANGPTAHRVSIRTGLPAVYYRMINQGVPTSKSTTAQVDETIGILEARSHIDTLLARLNGNTAAFRMSEDKPFMESMAQEMASQMFYGNPGTDPRQFMGLQTRYSLLSAGNGGNIIDAGGTSTDNASIYLVVWGENGVFMTYPKGSQAGLLQQDLGEESVTDANGNYYQAYRTLYQWQNGLVVQDWRNVVRIANIDVSDLRAGTGTQATTAATFIVDLMSRALDMVPNINGGRAVFYANRTAMSMLRVQARRGTGSVLAIEAGLNQFGQSINEMRFLGVPVRKVDQLLSTEARVV